MKVLWYFISTVATPSLGTGNTYQYILTDVEMHSLPDLQPERIRFAGVLNTHPDIITLPILRLQSSYDMESPPQTAAVDM
jgi:hypothetical protein